MSKQRRALANGSIILLFFPGVPSRVSTYHKIFKIFEVKKNKIIIQKIDKTVQ